jgi:hypothetical protein
MTTLHHSDDRQAAVTYAQKPMGGTCRPQRMHDFKHDLQPIDIYGYFLDEATWARM